MPQIFKIGSFWVYFWSNEGVPLEPVHVHVSEVISVCKGSLLAKKCKLELLRPFYVSRRSVYMANQSPKACSRP